MKNVNRFLYFKLLHIHYLCVGLQYFTHKCAHKLEQMLEWIECKNIIFKNIKQIIILLKY